MKHLALLSLAVLAACGGGGAGSAESSLPTIIAPQAPVVTVPRIAVLGDSISQAPGPNTSFPALMNVAQNLGIPGADAGIALQQETPQLASNTTTVVFEVGTNDIWASSLLSNPVGAEQTVETQMDALAAAVRAALPKALFVFVTVRDLGRANIALPGYPDAGLTAAVNEWNTHEKAVATQYGATVLDMQTDPQWYVATEYVDGIHPTAAGAQHWASVIGSLTR